MKYLIFILILGSCVGKPKAKSEYQKYCDSVIARAMALGWRRDEIQAPCDIDTTLLPERGSVHPVITPEERAAGDTLEFYGRDHIFGNNASPRADRWSKMIAKFIKAGGEVGYGVAGRTLDATRGDCANNPITKSNDSDALFAMGDEDCLYSSQGLKLKPYDNRYLDTTPKHFIIYDKSKIPGYPEYDSARRKTIGTTDVREWKLTLYWDSVPRHQYGYMLDSKEKITLWDRNGNGYSFDSVEITDPCSINALTGLCESGRIANQNDH